MWFALLCIPYPLSPRFSHSCALVCIFFALSCIQQKLNPFFSKHFRTPCEKPPGVGEGGTRKPAKPGPSIFAIAPLPATTAPAPGKASPQLYSPLRRSPLAGSRQEYPADPQRLVSHRESPRRQPGLSRFDARVSRLCTQNPRSPGRLQQFHPFDCLVSRRHSRSGILWDLHSSCASGRRAYCHFQRLGHAEEQRGSGSWPGRSEKSELEGHFSQCFLSADLAAYCRSRLDFHGHHARGKCATPPWPKSSFDFRCADSLGARGSEHLSLLRLRPS